MTVSRSPTICSSRICLLVCAHSSPQKTFQDKSTIQHDLAVSRTSAQGISAWFFTQFSTRKSIASCQMLQNMHGLSNLFLTNEPTNDSVPMTSFQNGIVTWSVPFNIPRGKNYCWDNYRVYIWISWFIYFACGDQRRRLIRFPPFFPWSCRFTAWDVGVEVRLILELLNSVNETKKTVWRFSCTFGQKNCY
jgi:hypothetical protein